MRTIPSLLAALLALTILSACGTKTSLTLPPAVDNSNKASAEPRQ